MPYRDDIIRVQNFNLAIIPDTVAAKFTARKTFMGQLQQAQQAILVAIEQCVRSKLDAAGIFGNFRIPYLNFARTLYSASGSQSGVALQKVTTAKKAAWVAMGEDSALLDDCATCVFGTVHY